MTSHHLFLFMQSHKLAVLSSVTLAGTPQSALVGIAVTPTLEIISIDKGCPRRLLLQVQAVVDSVKRQFKPVGNAQLVKYIVKVILHRLLGDEHLLGNFLVLITLRNQNDDLAFALAELRTFPRRFAIIGGCGEFSRRRKLADDRRRGV